MATAQAADAPGDFVGRTIGRFHIKSAVGAGGMGEVYLAEDTVLHRPVAVKRLSPKLRNNADARRNILREAQRASALNSPHIASVYDVVEDGDELLLVMEYVDGKLLRHRMRALRNVPVEEFLSIAVQCADALAAAHARSIIHRDIKPENIMLNAGGLVKVLDFGLARQVQVVDDSAATVSVQSSDYAGTPGYMAPEVLREHEVDARADIFSLGVVFYEMLAGEHPFRAPNAALTTDRVLHDDPQPLAKTSTACPAELERIVSKMLAKNPAARYATAADLAVDLRAVQQGKALPARRAGLFSKAARIVGIVLLLLVIVSVLPVLRDQWRRWRGTAELPDRKYVAVLPFHAIDPNDQVYGQGLAETLTAKLTQLTRGRELAVAPASEVRARGITDATKARADLGVNLVLEGSMHRMGKQMRVSYALVDVAERKQLRADTVTVSAGDPFAMEDRVAEGVARMLDLRLGSDEHQVLAAHGTEVAAAYESYLKGRGLLQNYDKPENVDAAISEFKQALRADPEYALAEAGLGEATWAQYESTRDPVRATAAQEYCAQAAKLDGTVAAPHICLGTVANGTGQYETAVGEFQRAVEAEPTNDAAYRGLGLAYQHVGKTAEAERTYQRAIDLRPHYWAGYSWMGAFLYSQGRYDEAAHMFQRVIDIVPDSFRGYYNLGGIYILQGKYAQAVTLLERSVSMRPSGGGYSNLGTAYFYLHRFADAAAAFEQAVRLDERDYLSWGNLGDAYSRVPGKEAETRSAFQNALAYASAKVKVNPKDRESLSWAAVYNSELGNQKAAQENINSALRGAAADPNLLYRAALVYLRAGDKDVALEYLRKAVAAGLAVDTVRASPSWDSMRSDRRLQNLLDGKK